MKKKLLLIALPALMVLSGCSHASIKPVEKEVLSDAVMLEDTVAHDDLFGGINLNIRKLGEPEGDPAGDDPSWTKMPKIGVQFSDVYKGDERDGEGEPTGNKVDYRAVRYVAAIADTVGMTATWTRGVSTKEGSPVRALTGGKVSSTRYSELNNGGDPKSATSEGTGYEKYVVYTMYDIPVAQADSYIVAYLTLSDGVHEAVKSKAVASQIDGGHPFSFSSDTNGYFIHGTINNTANITQAIDSALSEKDIEDENKAKKTGLTLKAGDSFALFQFTSSEFHYFSNSEAYDSYCLVDDEAVGFENNSKVRVAGKYTFFVNKDTEYGLSPEQNINAEIYFKPGVWSADSARIYIWRVDRSEAGSWLASSSVTDGIYKFDLDIAQYPKFIFVRLNSAGEIDWGIKWNQTDDIAFKEESTLSSDLLKNKFQITGWGDGNSPYSRGTAW